MSTTNFKFLKKGRESNPRSFFNVFPFFPVLVGNNLDPFDNKLPFAFVNVPVTQALSLCEFLRRFQRWETACQCAFNVAPTAFSALQGAFVRVIMVRHVPFSGLVPFTHILPSFLRDYTVPPGFVCFNSC
jgi:hypothetical protein